MNDTFYFIFKKTIHNLFKINVQYFIYEDAIKELSKNQNLEKETENTSKYEVKQNEGVYDNKLGKNKIDYSKFNLFILEIQKKLSRDVHKSTPVLPEINNKIMINDEQVEKENEGGALNLAKVSKIQTEIQLLVSMMEREQVEKEMSNALKTCFLAWQYTEEGFAQKEEFESKLKLMNYLMSTKLLNSLFKFLISK